MLHILHYAGVDFLNGNVSHCMAWITLK